MIQPKLVVRKYLYLSLLLIIFVGCHNEKQIDKVAAEVYKLDVVKGIDDIGPLFASSLVKSFEYTPLEYSSRTLIRNFKVAYLISDTTVLVKGFRRIAIFNRNNGEYLYDIGHYGEDPNGYRSSLSSVRVTSSSLSVFAYGWKNDIVEYSLAENKIISSVKMPEAGNSVPFKSELIVSSFIQFDSVNFLGFVSNHSGDQAFKLVFFNKKGEILKAFLNHQRFRDTDRIVFSSDEGSFHEFNKGIYFKEDFNDTIFQVDLNGIYPRYYFNLGQKSPPYSEKETMSFTERRNYIFVKDIIETSKHLIFNIHHQGKSRIGIYSKEKDVLQISDLTNLYDFDSHGLTNDIDDFIPFYPQAIYGDYIIGLTPAEIVAGWFESNRHKINALPENLKALKDIAPDANPVLMIGKLK